MMHTIGNVPEPFTMQSNFYRPNPNGGVGKFVQETIMVHGSAKPGDRLVYDQRRRLWIPEGLGSTPRPGTGETYDVI